MFRVVSHYRLAQFPLCAVFTGICRNFPSIFSCLSQALNRERGLEAEEVRFRLSLIQAWPSFLFLIIETVADAAFFVLILQPIHHFWLP